MVGMSPGEHVLTGLCVCVGGGWGLFPCVHVVVGCSKWTSLNRSMSPHVVCREGLKFPCSAYRMGPPVNKQTDRTTENITFPQTTHASGNKYTAWRYFL